MVNVYTPSKIRKNQEVFDVSVSSQISTFKKHFEIVREFKTKNNIRNQSLPKDGQSFFVGLDFALFSDTYEGALEEIFSVLSEKRKFRNDLEKTMHSKHLRFGSLCEAMFKMISKEQDDSPIIIYPAQLGEKYYGLTPGKVNRRLRGDKFGLSTFMTACILLTHPKLLSTENELAICCVGDEYSPNGDYNFNSTPIFFLDNDGETIVLDYVNKGTTWNNKVGCASAYFIPI